MKLKALLITALFVAGIAASVAVAKGPPGARTGSTSTSTTPSPACKPIVSFVLRGEFTSAGVSTGTAGEGSFQMDVEKSNWHARVYQGKTVTISVDAKTKFRRNGHATLADFEAGDHVDAHVRACKAPKAKERDGGTTSTPTMTGASPSADQPKLLARMVKGRPAKGSEGEGGDG